jgi:hypothetical protein
VDTWHVVAAANAVVAVAYLAISRAIILPLARERELTTNKLGTATALIFLTCAVHHGAHTAHMLLPFAGVATDGGLAMRSAFDGWAVGWDLITAGIGVYYWTLRRSYGRLLQGTKLFEDHREKQREALEINDTVVQGLVAAQLARAAGRDEELDAALAGSLQAARVLVDRLLGARAAREGAADAGDFVRDVPARVTPP